MKIARKKIPKGSFLLAASFAAISACLLLVLRPKRQGGCTEQERALFWLPEIFRYFQCRRGQAVG